MTAKAKPDQRVKFVIDEDASFEECHGEGRPLTEEEYQQNQYRACPQHPRAGTREVSVAMGRRIQGCTVCGNSQYQDIPYQEYLQYYGNPDRHVYLGCVTQEYCTCCGQWKASDSLWRIDLMDDSPELRQVQIGAWLTAEQATALSGYLGEVARDVLHG